MADTKIEWADKVWNCIRGCSLVSDGCRNCYAMRQAHRFSGYGMPYHGLTIDYGMGPRWNGDIMLVPDKLGDPLKVKKPSRFFVNSMSDLFHEGVDDSFIDRVFGVIQLCPQHQFQILTKRPERMRQYMNEPGRGGKVMLAAAREAFDEQSVTSRNGRFPDTADYIPINDQERAFIEGASQITVQGGTWPPPNAWMGTSVENQKTFEDRLQYLIATKAVVRWLSCEPLLGPIDMQKTIQPFGWTATANALANISWVVVGGESGPGSRPLHPDWVRFMRDATKSRGIAFFFKQWGDWAACGPVVKDRSYAGGARFESASGGQTAIAAVSDGSPYYRRLNDVVMERVGKVKAGRLLDGREWNEYPEGK